MLSKLKRNGAILLVLGFVSLTILIAFFTSWKASSPGDDPARSETSEPINYAFIEVPHEFDVLHVELDSNSQATEIEFPKSGEYEIKVSSPIQEMQLDVTFQDGRSHPIIIGGMQMRADKIVSVSEGETAILRISDGGPPALEPAHVTSIDATPLRRLSSDEAEKESETDEK